MSEVRFLADHDLKDQIVKGVLRRQPTIQFIHVRDVGVARLPDDDVLAYAAEHGLVTVSHDVNTMRAAAFSRIERGLPMAGLLTPPQRKPLSPVIEDLILIWSASSLEEWNGVVRYLPLR